MWAHVAGVIMLLAGAAGAQAPACSGFPQVKTRLYSLFIVLVADDLRALPNAGDQVALQAGVEALAQSYAEKSRFGDSVYLSKLVGVGLFSAMGLNQEPIGVTFRVVCNMAGWSPRVLDPLGCAAIALDGSRRENADNRALARRMVAVAQEKIAEDRNSGAQRLYDESAPVLLACAGE
jgi:hypothetical protein